METSNSTSLQVSAIDRPDVDRQLSVGGSQAIVIGGGMAGLLAARVLTDHFDHVIIVERDRYPAGPEQRSGVPQARHVHGLLVQGYRVLNQLFPGLEAELLAAGAPRLDWTADFPTLSAGGWSPRYPSGLVTHACSRALLEFLVRRRLAARSNLTILEGREVTDLLYDQGRATVTGVRVRSRGKDQGSSAEEIRGVLVVDASGRSSHTPDWLQALGFGRPVETTINAFLGYASRWYRPPPDLDTGWKAVGMTGRAPDQRRGGVLYPVEGGRWIVTLAGVARDYPPTDATGFLAFARSLRSPVLYDAIREAEPLSSISGYQRTDNCLRHYERLARWPERFIVVGDAACAFNPIYGQGMTVAALEAVALGELLKKRSRRPSHDPAMLSRQFQERLAAVLQTPWLMATGEDLRWPTTEGDRSSVGTLTRLAQRYVDQILVVMPRSPAVHRAFSQVVHLTRPPALLFRPDIVLRVAEHTLVRCKTAQIVDLH